MTTSPTALQEWRQHWPLVLAAFSGFAFYSFRSPATGLFMPASAHWLALWLVFSLGAYPDFTTTTGDKA